MQLGEQKEGADVLVWKPTDDGSFTSKSAWDCIRIKASKVRWAEWVWHTALPKKISVMMWKAIQYCLPMDDHIRRAGIPIVSKCQCCDMGKYEDQNHILATGNIAEEIWRRISVHLRMPYNRGSCWREKQWKCGLGVLPGPLPKVRYLG